MLPQGAKVFPLAEGTKVPKAGSRGHYDATAGDAPVGNYGIALDDAFLVVDFDREDSGGWKERLPATWRQKTPRGEHFLYRLPRACPEARNTKFLSGDIKVRGYIVGPGSVVEGKEYVMVDAREPVDAPEWLAEYVTTQSQQSELSKEGDKSALGEGERNESLVRFGGLMRRMGLEEAAIAKGLDALNKTLVEPPLSRAEVRVIAKHAAKYGVVAGGTGPLVPDGWTSAADISLVGPPTRWWVRGFVPKGELVMLYGRGGTGKSSWGSWLAVEATRKGARFAFAGVEEPFVRFAARSVLGNAVPDLLLRVPQASGLVLPRDAAKLAEVLEITQTDILYFDSIYAHFEVVAGQNSAERARRCLSPLAEIAQEMGKTIVAVFHENKMGQLLGSLEMENVARVSLHATREEARPLFISVDKTNLRRPDYHMTFVGQEVAITDPHSGEMQYEEMEDGTLKPETMFVLRRGEDVARASVMLDSVEDTAEGVLEDLLAAHPEWSNARLAAESGLSVATVAHTVPEIRRTLGLPTNTGSVISERYTIG